ncbi:glycosyltransferase family 4 protein [Chloroflexi bacterium TSY]|nr:glycosyltransferase family 4 protein [Chloroflexi bacterium TSY]
MRVVMVSKALVVGAYQRKAQEIAQLGVDLTVLVPPYWQDSRGRHVAEEAFTEGYTFKVIPMRFNGHFHLHYYPTLAHELRHLQPQILHMDEEPYNLSTWFAMRACQKLGILGTFFTWQNIDKRYPPPFGWWEKAVLQNTSVAIAGNQASGQILRRKGFQNEIITIPQFGVDPNIFKPQTRSDVTSTPSTIKIGYAGGLVPEKGVDLLIRACAGLEGNWSLEIVGSGVDEKRLRKLCVELGVINRVRLGRSLSSMEMPDFYRGLDIFVLPSRTMSNWKEQFGRVLIEAMASEVVVVGSNSGEISNVIGNAGLIFEEGNVDTLRERLFYLLKHPQERARLRQAGRHRVLQQFTMKQIAVQTVEAYNELLRNEQCRNHTGKTTLFTGTR